MFRLTRQEQWLIVLVMLALIIGAIVRLSGWPRLVAPVEGATGQAVKPMP